ncbi:MATE efflux family protein [Nitratireductor indicus C115]|uniref:MATE efflux family protein n=1 Tax=Nitratireductor indicus C115 TaxID=1231190 RepID=K2NZ99_9HYPH|nr:MATE family efflux transporter [Nitratireductor indicus]EKF44555.1 MATE efflux family protein [Nitratireductor indicus C115]SFQ31288.1 putative efflux protein, MATE family [Nitratireductor indicus]
MRPFEVTNRLVLGIALPMTFAYLTTPLLGIVDTAIIGQFGDAALLGGLAAGAIVFDVVFTTFNFLRAGTTGLVAQAFGRDDTLEEQAVLLRALLIAIVAGFVIVLLGPFINAGGILFIDPEPRVAEAMNAYVSVRILGAPLTLINYAILGYVLGRGEGLLGLLLQILLNGANIALSVLLGLYLGWGIAGVAWGTLGGEALSALVGFAILVRRFRQGPGVARSRVFDLPEIMRMVAMNRDIMIRSFSLLAVFALFTREGAQFGTLTLAANAVLMNFFLISSYFLDGLATAAEQLAGRAVGAHYEPAFRRSVRLTGLWGFGVALLMAGFFLLFGSDLVSLIARSPEVQAAAGIYLPWAAFISVAGVLAFQMDGVFIGATWSRDMRNMMLVSLAIYLVALYSLTAVFGNHGLWAALYVSLVARGMSLASILPRRTRQVFAS